MVYELTKFDPRDKVSHLFEMKTLASENIRDYYLHNVTS